MLFVPVIRRSAFGPSLRAFDRFFTDSAPARHSPRPTTSRSS